jgi:hypothetical protein
MFERIESFFVRLEIYTEVPLTPAMTGKMVQITVEILDVLATATKEMGQSQASEFDLRLMLLEADIDSEKFIKKLAGWTHLEDGLKKLEKLTNDEIAMASARLLKVTDNIGHGVRSVDKNVQAVKDGVQLVGGNVKAVDDKLQKIAEGGQSLFRVQRHL